MQQSSGGSLDPSVARIASAAHDTLAADRKRLRPRLARKLRGVAAPTFPAESKSRRRHGRQRLRDTSRFPPRALTQFVRAFGVAFLRRMIGAGVVLVVVDLLAGIVLLMVHLRAFLRRQLAAVSRAVVVHFIADARLFIFQVAGFARR